MFQILLEDNEELIEILKEEYDVAESERAFDISDMLAERIAAHKKHGWMLNAFLNKQQG